MKQPTKLALFLLLLALPAGAYSAPAIYMNPGTSTACVLTPDTTTLLTIDTAGNAVATGTLSGACVGTTPPVPPDPPPSTACQGLQPLDNGAGGNWIRVVKSVSVKFGDNTIATNRDSTDYLSLWTYPGITPYWPGNSGLTTRPSGAAKNQFFAEKFVVSATGRRPNWAWSGSGTNSNASLTISACPGDFGQTGTVLTTGCRTDFSSSSSGLTAIVSATQTGNFCSLKPGAIYYLNLLPMGHLPEVLTGASISYCDASTCSPWFGIN